MNGAVNNESGMDGTTNSGPVVGRSTAAAPINFRATALARFTDPEALDALLQFVRLRPALLLALLTTLRGRLTRSQRRAGRRVRTPTVLQMEATECGAAALGIVLSYHGRIVPLEELRVRCGVTRDGSKASNLLRAARGYGLLAKGYRKEPDRLAELPLPVIVFWNFTHYLVVEGFGPDRVYLNDPATGPRTVSPAEFDAAYTGIVLVLAPGPEFQPGGSRPSLRAALRRRLVCFEAPLLGAVGLSLLLLGPGLAVPLLTQTFVDRVLIHHRVGWFAPVLFGLALAGLLGGVLAWAQGAVLVRLQLGLARATARAFVAHALRLPIEFYTQRYPGVIAERVGTNDRVARLLSGELSVSALSAVLIVVYAVVMVRYSWLLTLIGLGVALLNVIALRASARYRVDGNHRLRADRARMVGTAYSTLQAIETVKASGAEAEAFARWAGFQARVVNATQDLALPAQLLAVVPTLLGGLNTAAILILGAVLVLDGRLTAGALFAFWGLMLAVLLPVTRLVGLSGAVQEVDADMARLDDVLRYPPDPTVGPLDGPHSADTPACDRHQALAERAPARLRGELELRDVTFGYNRLEPPLIEGLSLTMAPGARVALLGGSGSGKSTIARLVCGLYAPWSGRILFDGTSRADLPRPLLTASLAAVDQDIHLFAGTVRENITLWDARICQGDVERAARDAAIHDEILARPGGYDSLLEEEGRDLSGGQRQRLEIARALARNPTVLVLDEATSALDPATEQAVLENLRLRGCTCLVVAHRVSTIRDADEILVLEEGTVVQRGTHEALLGVQGAYSRLIAAGAESLGEGPVPEGAWQRPEHEWSGGPSGTGACHEAVASGHATAGKGEAHPEAALSLSAPEAASAPPDSHDDKRLWEACRLVGAALGVTMRLPPVASGGDPLDDIARASCLRTRQVLLHECWWQGDSGPLLAYRAADRQPVALLPAGPGRYVLADPETGSRTRVTAEIAATVTPYAMMFYRPLPQRSATPRDVLRCGFAGGRRDLAAILALGLAGGVAALAAPLATRRIFDVVIPGARRGELGPLALALIASAVAITLFELLQKITLVRLESRVDVQIQAAVWDRLLSLPVGFFRRFEAGDLGDRATGLSAIHQTLSETVVSAVLAAIFSLVSLVLLFVFDAGLALVAVGLILLFMVLTALVSRALVRRQRALNAAQGQLSSLVLQLFTAIARLRVAGAEGRALARWAAGFAETQRLTVRVGEPRLALAAITGAFPIVATLTLYALVSRGGTVRLPTGTFLAFAAAFAQVMAAGVALAGTVTSLAEAIPLYERAAPILRALPESDAGGLHPGKLSGAIHLEAVSFSYRPDGPRILEDVSLEIRPGECVAIVGPSGAGKSTLLRLLLGFERPEGGAVRYDGRDLMSLDVREVRRQIGVVLQNGSVLPGPILHNIIGASGLSVDAAWEAARLAGLAQDIERLPMGMYTIVSEGGSTFSGGQRQRLLIARALARCPRLVYFDEATSALDNATQAAVGASVAGLRATRVLIAHRLSTIQQADHIIVLEGGRVVQSGRYNDLIRQEGLFRTLALRQMVAPEEV